MNVKNIIIKCAEFLEMKSVIKYLNNETELTDMVEDDINNILLAVNMVNNNIASSYLELVGSKKINAKDFNIAYSDISNKQIIEIKKVTGLNGEKISYSIFPDYLEVGKCGVLIIEYSYFPDSVGLDDDINYYFKMNELTFAVGVVSEYLYLKGAIDDAYIWDKKFKSNMFNLLRPKRNIVLPAKRW